MAEKKIGEIKEELKAVDDEKLPSFIETYEKDERSGVVKIVEQAKKRFEKLEAEKLRIENLKKYEREYADYGYICGIDEVGRGPCRSGGSWRSYFAKRLRYFVYQRF